MEAHRSIGDQPQLVSAIQVPAGATVSVHPQGIARHDNIALH
jgi:hypothetical protein